VLCYLFWNQGVAALGPNRTGMFLYLIPVFGSVLSALILRERPEAYHAVGFALVLAGLALGNWQRK
jgi:drug/metabolite transporter (DMT)-like permease